MNSKEQNETIKQKMNAIERNDTQSFVDQPNRIKPLNFKWVFNAKIDNNGNVKKYKGRLVVRGYFQKSGIDYFETFSHIVKQTTIRCMVALATRIKWKIRHIDVKTTFLIDILKEEIFMKILDG